MKKKITKAWVKAAGIRALKTATQTALGFLTVGSAMNAIDWTTMASVVAVSTIYSILTSISTTLPECKDVV